MGGTEALSQVRRARGIGIDDGHHGGAGAACGRRVPTPHQPGADNGHTGRLGPHRN